MGTALHRKSAALPRNQVYRNWRYQRVPDHCLTISQKIMTEIKQRPPISCMISPIIKFSGYLNVINWSTVYIWFWSIYQVNILVPVVYVQLLLANLSILERRIPSNWFSKRLSREHRVLALVVLPRLAILLATLNEHQNF